MPDDTNVVRLDAGEGAALTHQLAHGEPFVLAGAAAEWPAVGKWTQQWLTAEFGEEVVPFRLAPGRAHPHFALSLDRTLSDVATAPLGDYITRAREDPTVFLDANLVRLASRRGNVHRGLTPLLADTRPLACLADAAAVDTVGLWISGCGVRSRLHYDRNGRHNVNVQVAGVKDFILVHPRHVAELEPLPMMSPVYNFCGIDTGDTDLFATLLGRGISWRAGTLTAGDVLFLPAFWYHAFEHRGELNINVNSWVDAPDVVLGPAALRNEVATLLQAAVRDVPAVSQAAEDWHRFVERIEHHALAWTPTRAAIDDQ
jgi:Cupin-like domain